MPRVKFISSITDWFLVITAAVLFTLEMVAVAGYVPLITTETVEISVFQLWVPAALGALMGHFFPLPFSLFGRKKYYTRNFLIALFAGVGFYLLWYFKAPEAQVNSVLDILADRLYAFFLGGYFIGSEFFLRGLHPLEREDTE